MLFFLRKNKNTLKCLTNIQTTIAEIPHTYAEIKTLQRNDNEMRTGLSAGLLVVRILTSYPSGLPLER